LLSINDLVSFALRHPAVPPIAGAARRHLRLIGHRLERAVGT
jgi:hypothetical protein